MTPYEFCTLFDVRYLPRALVLHRSLMETCPAFTLRAFCMDERAKELLDRLALPNVVPIGLGDLEAHDPALVAVKPTRNRIEYCWTATPAVCLYALEREPSLESITYLDADLMFFSDPAPLFAELGAGSTMIVPHRYPPSMEAWEQTSGIYNVEWLTFRRDEHGLAALRWWRDRCIEWCYARYEDGKMGDQKYLDDWPERFEGVHVLQHPGGGLAPWNVGSHEVTARGGEVFVDGWPLVFFHHHSLRIYSSPVRALRRIGLWRGRLELSAGAEPLAWELDYPLRWPVKELVWDPYVERLGKAIARVDALGPHFDTRPATLRGLLRYEVRRRVWRVRKRMGRLVGDLPGVRRRYSEGWRQPDVSRQMLELAREQLRDPEAVPPYRSFLELVEWLLGERQLPRPASVLDVGCGVGHYSELLERRFPGRFAYTGSDFSESMIELARGAWPGRTFVIDDLLESRLDLDEFDVVLSAALVDVLSDFRRALGVLLGSRAPYVVLHRQRVTDDESRVETAPGYVGQQTYRTHLSRRELDSIVSQHGRYVAHVVPVEGEVESFVLARRDS